MQHAPVDGIVESKANTLFIYGVIVLHLLLNSVRIVPTSTDHSIHGTKFTRSTSRWQHFGCAAGVPCTHVPSTPYTVHCSENIIENQIRFIIICDAFNQRMKKKKWIERKMAVKSPVNVCAPDDSTYMLPAATQGAHIHLSARPRPTATTSRMYFPRGIDKKMKKKKAHNFSRASWNENKIRSRLRRRWSDRRTAEVPCASMYARHFSYLFMISFASSSYLRPSSFPSNHISFHRTRAFCINFVELASRDEKSIGL